MFKSARHRLSGGSQEQKMPQFEWSATSLLIRLAIFILSSGPIADQCAASSTSSKSVQVLSNQHAPTGKLIEQSKISFDAEHHRETFSAPRSLEHDIQQHQLLDEANNESARFKGPEKRVEGKRKPQEAASENSREAYLLRKFAYDSVADPELSAKLKQHQRQQLQQQKQPAQRDNDRRPPAETASQGSQYVGELGAIQFDDDPNGVDTVRRSHSADEDDLARDSDRLNRLNVVPVREGNKSLLVAHDHRRNWTRPEVSLVAANSLLNLSGGELLSSEASVSIWSNKQNKPSKIAESARDKQDKLEEQQQQTTDLSAFIERQAEEGSSRAKYEPQVYTTLDSRHQASDGVSSSDDDPKQQRHHKQDQLLAAKKYNVSMIDSSYSLYYGAFSGEENQQPPLVALAKPPTVSERIFAPKTTTRTPATTQASVRFDDEHQQASPTSKHNGQKSQTLKPVSLTSDVRVRSGLLLISGNDSSSVAALEGLTRRSLSGSLAAADQQKLAAADAANSFGDQNYDSPPTNSQSLMYSDDSDGIGANKHFVNASASQPKSLGDGSSSNGNSGDDNSRNSDNGDTSLANLAARVPSLISSDRHDASASAVGNSSSEPTSLGDGNDTSQLSRRDGTDAGQSHERLTEESRAYALSKPKRRNGIVGTVSTSSAGIHMTTGANSGPLVINRRGLITAAKRNSTGRPYPPSSLPSSQLDHSSPIRIAGHSRPSSIDLFERPFSATGQIISGDLRPSFLKQPVGVSGVIWNRNGSSSSSNRYQHQIVRQPLQVYDSLNDPTSSYLLTEPNGYDEHNNNFSQAERNNNNINNSYKTNSTSQRHKQQAAAAANNNYNKTAQILFPTTSFYPNPPYKQHLPISDLASASQLTQQQHYSGAGNGHNQRNSTKSSNRPPTSAGINKRPAGGYEKVPYPSSSEQFSGSPHRYGGLSTVASANEIKHSTMNSLAPYDYAINTTLPGDNTAISPQLNVFTGSGGSVSQLANSSAAVATALKPAKIINKLQEMIIGKILKNQGLSYPALNLSQQAAVTASELQTSGSSPTPISLAPLPTPAPILSSTVANNIASLLASKLNFLVRPPFSSSNGHFGGLFGLKGGVKPIKQRVNPFVSQTSQSNISRRSSGFGSLIFSGFIYGLSVLPALMALTGINPLVSLADSIDTRNPTLVKMAANRHGGGGVGGGNSANNNNGQSKKSNKEMVSAVALADLAAGSPPLPTSAYAYLIPLVSAAAAELETEQELEAAAPVAPQETRHSSQQPPSFKSLFAPASSVLEELPASINSLDGGGGDSSFHPLLDEPASLAQNEDHHYLRRQPRPTYGRSQKQQFSQPIDSSSSDLLPEHVPSALVGGGQRHASSISGAWQGANKATTRPPPITESSANSFRSNNHKGKVVSMATADALLPLFEKYYYGHSSQQPNSSGSPALSISHAGGADSSLTAGSAAARRSVSQQQVTTKQVIGNYHDLEELSTSSPLIVAVPPVAMLKLAPPMISHQQRQEQLKRQHLVLSQPQPKLAQPSPTTTTPTMTRQRHRFGNWADDNARHSDQATIFLKNAPIATMTPPRQPSFYTNYYPTVPAKLTATAVRPHLVSAANVLNPRPSLSSSPLARIVLLGDKRQQHPATIVNVSLAKSKFTTLGSSNSNMQSVRHHQTPLASTAMKNIYEQQQFDVGGHPKSQFLSGTNNQQLTTANSTNHNAAVAAATAALIVSQNRQNDSNKWSPPISAILRKPPSQRRKRRTTPNGHQLNSHLTLRVKSLKSIDGGGVGSKPLGNGRFQVGYTLNYKPLSSGSTHQTNENFERQQRAPTIEGGRKGIVESESLIASVNANDYDYNSNQWRAVNPPQIRKVSAKQRAQRTQANYGDDDHLVELLKSSSSHSPFYFNQPNITLQQATHTSQKITSSLSKTKLSSGRKLGSKEKPKKDRNAAVAVTTTTDLSPLMMDAEESKLILSHTLALGSKILNEPATGT